MRKTTKTQRHKGFWSGVDAIKNVSPHKTGQSSRDTPKETIPEVVTPRVYNLTDQLNHEWPL